MQPDWQCARRFFHPERLCSEWRERRGEQVSEAQFLLTHVGSGFSGLPCLTVGELLH